MAGKLLVFASADRQARAVRLWRERLSRDGALQLFVFPELDRALEFCENRLLGKSDLGAGGPPLALAAHPTLQGLAPEQVRALEAVLERLSFAAGEPIVRRGDEADRIYFGVQGVVRVTALLPNGQQKRLSTLGRHHRASWR
jgi:hypothetical protein